MKRIHVGNNESKLNLYIARIIGLSLFSAIGSIFYPKETLILTSTLVVLFVSLSLAKDPSIDKREAARPYNYPPTYS